MVKFIFNKKSLMKFGKWSLALFSLVLLGFFVVQYIIPILAMDPPTQVYLVNVTLLTPTNMSHTTATNGNLNFTYNVSWGGFNVTNCTLFGNFTGTFDANVSNATDGYTLQNNVANGLNMSLNDGYYIWNVYCYNETDHGSFYTTSNFSVTMDNTTPVIRNLDPADDTYIYGTSTQLFQANLTELNLNTTATNVTLYYRLCESPSSCGDWSTTFSNVTNCYANPAAPDYVCNATVNLNTNPWAETNIVEFFYNVSDPAGNTVHNGTESSPNNVTIDRTAPQYSNVDTNDSDDTIGTSDGINLTVYWTDSYDLAYATLSTNETGTYENKSDYSSPITMDLTGYWSNFTWSNSSVSAGTVVGFKVYANDTVGNQNVSSEGTFTLDGTSPQWSANASSIESIYSSTKSSFNVTWSDNVNLHIIFLEGNWSGSAANYTTTDLSGGSNVYNYNETLPAGGFYWKVYANDTSGNWNTTDSWEFTIPKAPTSTSLYLNGTEADRTYNVNDAYNFTVVVNVSGKDANLTTNITGWIDNKSTTPHENLSTMPSSPGYYNITGFFQADTNYSASSQTYYVTVYGWANTTTELNTSWIKQGEQLNITCNVSNSNSSAGLQGYYVEILNGTTSLTTGRTDSDGEFVYEWAPQNEGSQTIKCAIYDNTTSYYNVSYNDTKTYVSDFTLPSLSDPKPADNSHIRGISTQLFQINISETNFNTSSNATLYYRKQGSAWSSVVMECDEEATSIFICNKTRDITSGVGYLEGNVVQYFFNLTDNATNVGEYGNSGSPLSVTIDRTAPTYANNATNATTVAKGGAVLIYAQWTDNYNLSYATLSTNETGSWANHTANYSSPVNMVANTIYWSNFTWNGSVDSGSRVEWRIYVNDSAGNENVTDAVPFTIDETLPQFWDNDTNVTQGTIGKDKVILVYFNWTDDVELAYAWLETNETGTWENKTGDTYDSPVTLSGTSSWSNFTWTNTSVTAGTVIHMRVYANDTSGNVNGSFNMIWTIDNTVPTWSSNETNITNGSTIVKGTVINLTTAWTDDTALSYYWCWNSSGSTNDTASAFDLSINNSECIIDTTSFSVGRFYATTYVNDTSSNQNATGNFTWVIDNTAPTYFNESNSISGENEYLPSVTYTMNISWGDNLGDSNVSVTILEWNGSTNYTSGTTPAVLSLGNSNYSITLTDLTAENYTYKWYANDTSANWNATGTLTLNITQNLTNPINTYITNDTATYTNGNVSISAGNTVTANGTFGYVNSGTMALYSNVTTENVSLVDVGSSYTTLTTLSSGVYVFVANTSGTINYTSNTTGPGTFYLTVTADTTAPTVTLPVYVNDTIRKSGAEFILNISVSDSTGVDEDASCNVTFVGTEVWNRTLTYSGGWCNGTIIAPTEGVGADGNFTINITVNDNASPTNEGYNDSYVLVIDNTTPVITGLTAPNNTYNKSADDGYMWINGTVYDNIKMGLGNVTISGNSASTFEVYNFTGVNNSAFAVYNNTTVSDGLVELTFTYTDNATNSISEAVQFYLDNTPPSTALALKNSSLGKYQPSNTQVIEIQVTDNLGTNETITLHYWTSNSTNTWWTSKTISGTPGTTTTYSTTIDIDLEQYLGVSGNEYVPFYIAGSDNATNSIAASVGGSISSPLANITISQWCGNNGTALAYCSYDEGAQGLTTGATNTYHSVEWSTYQLSGASSLSSNYTIMNVLSSISGSYSHVYYANYSDSSTPWLDYDPTQAWNLNTLRFGNNTWDQYYINVTSTGAVIRIEA